MEMKLMKRILMNSRLFKILIITLIILVFLILISSLFIKLYIPFGGTPSSSDRENYKKRASNYKDGKFYNENDFQMIYKETEKNTYTSTKKTAPIESLPTKEPLIIQEPNKEDLNITWLGHSTILMNINGMNILIDPVFSNYTSPVSFAGPTRYSQLPIDIKDLPKIDIIVISHDHYDHLDYKTIKLIDNKVDKYIVPLGVEKHLERWKVKSSKITNMAWWEEMARVKLPLSVLFVACKSRHRENMQFTAYRIKTGK
jgi:hypothetical protein